MDYTSIEVSEIMFENRKSMKDAVKAMLEECPDVLNEFLADSEQLLEDESADDLGVFLSTINPKWRSFVMKAAHLQIGMLAREIQLDKRAANN